LQRDGLDARSRPGQELAGVVAELVADTVLEVGNGKLHGRPRFGSNSSLLTTPG
jgi:hypothetical protein